MKRILGAACLAACLAAGSLPLTAQGRGGRGEAGAGASRAPKPFDQVITGAARKQTGIFTVYTQKDKVSDAEHLYFAIPTDQLDKDFLWTSLIARTPFGDGYGGDQVGDHVVRWVRHDDTILLREVDYRMVADPALPIASAVAASNNSNIVMAFPVAAWGPNHEAVIDVTRLYDTEVPEFSPRQRLRARGFDAARSFFDSARAFPENIEVEATQTYTTPLPAPGEDTGGRGARGARPAPPSQTVRMHFSMIKLPEDKMPPRLFDDRVGYFSVTQQDFSRDEPKAPTRTYITRWRLVKKDPGVALSEPVKPIVYYIDPATPVQWRKWIRKGIEDWQPAFEAAGFKNAIVAKDAPTPAEDPTWSPQDMRNSMIRWLPSTVENSVGPNIHDPRTGEILNAQVQIYQNVLNLVNDWYFTQVGPLDPRAASLPLPEDLSGRLLEYVVAHEVGHTLGFQHNMKSSSEYPVKDLRDAHWLATMGDVATLMDYARFDYVAQPEDHIPPEDLIPKIGPYDKWAVHWGYAPIPGASTPDEEKPTLDAWSREQDKTPWLRFTTDHADGADPGANTEAVGDADALYATSMGLKNLERVMNMLAPATTAKSGKPYDRMNEVYARILGQWATEMGHVAVMVGGVDSQDKHSDQSGTQFTPEPRARQAAAVAFLNQNAFATPHFLIQPKVTRIFEPDGAMGQIRTSQLRVLSILLQNQRLERMEQLAAEDGTAAYAPADFLADLRHGIWSELTQPQVGIDAYRRNLQDAYLGVVRTKLQENDDAMAEPRALLRAQLVTLTNDIRMALPRARDAATRAHLAAARDEIAQTLDPKFAPSPAAAGAGRGGRGGLEGPRTPPEDGLICWPDTGIYH
ncbi:MAG: zinc-dependent metalloprotease [Terriglobales bacterium]